MTYSYVANPIDSSLTGTAAYGTTYRGELGFIALVTAAEVIVSVTVLRPWSYRCSWGRALLLLVLLTPWLLFWGALGLHAGPTTHIRTVWLMLYWVGVFGSVLTSGLGAQHARRSGVVTVA
jgi:NhaP-type Na+/H+ or K+/H+ antiporter